MLSLIISYQIQFQALLTFRPALAEALLSTELGRRSHSGANVRLVAPLVSAVLTNIAQQVWYACYVPLPQASY